MSIYKRVKEIRKKHIKLSPSEANEIAKKLRETLDENSRKVRSEK